MKVWKQVTMIGFLLLLSGCQAAGNPQVTGNARNEKEEKALLTQTSESQPGYRILALGDSYTIGHSVEQPERWPVQLADALRAEGYPVDPPEIIARNGWTTYDLLAALDADPPEGTYDLVSLLIGVNNQFRGDSEEGYRQDLKRLLSKSVQWAGGDPENVLVVTIPDWGVMPFAVGRDRAQIGEAIDRFNTILVEEAQDAGAVVVDVTPISREALQRPQYVAQDGLHPSGEMYADWAALILPVAREILGEDNP